MAFDEVSSPVLAKKFSDTNFNAEDYVRGVLSKCDIYRSVYDQRNNIQKLGEETAMSLKKNVYRNYRQFIDTAKEISYLEAEMYQMSHLLTEQKSILADQIETDIFERPKGLPLPRNEREEEKSNTKEDFLDGLKASKPLLTELNSKELLLNGELNEYDPETYSSIHKIDAWLLTDTLLITSLVNSGKRDILTIFDLSDLAVVNVRYEQGAKNAFKILYALETRMFSAPSKDMKLAWLDQIEKAKKNYGKGVYLNAKRLSVMAKVKEIMCDSQVQNKEILEDKEVKFNPGAPLVNHSFPNLLKVDWLIELPEDLDMSIAQRDFDGAVKLVEKSRAYLADFPESSALVNIRNQIDTRLQDLVASLEKSLDNSLSSRHVSLRSIRVYVQHLIRLGKPKLACKLFLRNRGYEIKNSFKQLKMEGAVAIYITKLVNVFFTALIETGKEYKMIFPYNKNSSAFVVWAHNELQSFADKFCRQVFTRNTSMSAIAVCINISLYECERLQAIEVDLLFDLQHMLLKDVMSVMFDTRDQILERGKLRAMEETWIEMDFSSRPESLHNFHNEISSLGLESFEIYIKEDVVKLSLSTVTFTKDMLTFLNDCLKLYNSELHSTLVQCIFDMFKAQSIQFESLIKSVEMKSNKQFIMVNTEFVFGRVYPFVKSRLQQLVGSILPVLLEIDKEIDKLRKL